MNFGEPLHYPSSVTALCQSPIDKRGLQLAPRLGARALTELIRGYLAYWNRDNGWTFGPQ